MTEPPAFAALGSYSAGTRKQVSRREFARVDMEVLPTVMVRGRLATGDGVASEGR